MRNNWKKWILVPFFVLALIGGLLWRSYRGGETRPVKAEQTMGQMTAGMYGTANKTAAQTAVDAEERSKPAFARKGALRNARVATEEEVKENARKLKREIEQYESKKASERKKELELKKKQIQKKAAMKKRKQEAKRPYIMKDVPADNEFKSYERYTLLTSWKQAELQKKAHTDKNGMRKVGSRYCVALGSYYTTEIGTEFDLVMENGKVIPCILGDQKADIHTDARHQRGNNGGCVAEFIVDVDKLPEKARELGSVHWIPGLEGEIKSIKIYTDKKGI